MLIWGAGAAAFMLWSVASYLLLTRKLRATRVPARESDIAALRELTHKASLYRCGVVQSPMLLGLFRPCLYLPEREYGKSALRFVLAHELAHHRRRDVLLKWLALIANAVHWFNPALYLLRRELAQECELAADEAVIRLLDAKARMDYGRMLLDMSSKRKAAIGMPSAMLSSGYRGLQERLESIMNFKNKTRLSVAVSIVLILMLAVTAVACSTTVSRNMDPSSSPATVSELPPGPAGATADPDQAAGNGGHPADIQDDSAVLDLLHQRITIYMHDNGIGDSIQMQYDGEFVLLTLASDIWFESGGDGVDSQMRESLVDLAQLLALTFQMDMPFEVTVTGHTDTVPINTARFSSNWELSIARAISITEVLVRESGLNPDVFGARGSAGYSPIADNGTAEGRQLNRRIEVVVST
jgi:flagellar motor protein MotB